MLEAKPTNLVYDTNHKQVMPKAPILVPNFKLNLGRRDDARFPSKSSKTADTSMVEQGYGLASYAKVGGNSGVSSADPVKAMNCYFDITQERAPTLLNYSSMLGRESSEKRSARSFVVSKAEDDS